MHKLWMIEYVGQRRRREGKREKRKRVKRKEGRRKGVLKHFKYFI